PRTPEGIEYQSQILKAADKVDVAGLRTEMTTALAEGDSEWATKVLLLMGEEWVEERHTALLASGISAVERYRAKRAEKQATATGFLANPGQTVEDLRVKVLKINAYETHYSYHGGVSELILMQTVDTGHRLTWRTSRETDIEQGDELLITRAKVKEHRTDYGYDETVIYYTRYDHAELEVAA
ncbi:MAG TPA: hypothetical protein VK054_03705, partial [Beutenbergiaceae bacterium]|nr:hypothetical protein [Beutenbergiaceae bacterium]